MFTGLAFVDVDVRVRRLDHQPPGTYRAPVAERLHIVSQHDLAAGADQCIQRRRSGDVNYCMHVPRKHSRKGRDCDKHPVPSENLTHCKKALLMVQGRPGAVASWNR